MPHTPAPPTGHGEGDRPDATHGPPGGAGDRDRPGSDGAWPPGWLPGAPGLPSEPPGHDPGEYRRIDGSDILAGTDPEELVVRPHADRPEVVRVRMGDHVYEGDVDHLERNGPGSPRIADWEVTAITPAAVRGRNVRSGDEIEWDRETLETGLALGTYATALTDVESVTVSRVGRWATFESVDDAQTDGTVVPAGQVRTPGEPYIALLAVGDNGRSYRRRYRLLDSETGEVELVSATGPRLPHAPAVARRLEARIQDALAAEGYDVLVPEE